MTLRIFTYLLFFISLENFAQATNVLVYRSEFEQVDDVVYDINDVNENINNYVIVSGNDNNYYSINQVNGKLKILNPIPDTFNVIHTDNLIIAIGNTTYNIQIVDAYDYYMSNLPLGYTVLSADDDVFVDNNSSWTAYNNLWGKGTAIENQDFRIAIVKKNTFPNQSVLIWDVPNNASAYNGAAVWCYTNLFWGNRKNIRENLTGFPFRINSLSSLTLTFDFEQLFGNDQYKVALNLFTTDNPNLANFSENKGDFFFVFDQINTYLPPYPFSLPDITLEGKPFAVLYDNENNGEFYERRRVIVKDGLSVTQGTLNLKSLFDMYSNAGFLNTNQSIPNIQVGVEVTKGFGALRFNQLEFNSNTLSTNDYLSDILLFYPNPVEDKLFWKSGNIINSENTKVYNVLGKEMKVDFSDNYINLNSLPTGIYLIKSGSSIKKISKK